VWVQHGRGLAACAERCCPADFQGWGRDTPGLPCCFYVSSSPELQQTPLEPATMVLLGGHLPHLLLSKPSPIPPSQGVCRYLPRTQRGSAPQEPVGPAPSQQQPLRPPITSGLCDTWTPRDCKVEEGPLQQHVPAFPRGKQSSTHFIPALQCSTQ